jgi:hypothetical protein
LRLERAKKYKNFDLPVTNHNVLKPNISPEVQEWYVVSMKGAGPGGKTILMTALEADKKRTVKLFREPYPKLQQRMSKGPTQWVDIPLDQGKERADIMTKFKADGQEGRPSLLKKDGKPETVRTYGCTWCTPRVSETEQKQRGLCLHPSFLCPRTCQLDPGICLEKRNGEIAEQKGPVRSMATLISRVNGL